MLPFRSMLSIDPKSRTPVYVQIANEVIRQIQKGRIGPGLKMPGSRTLAQQLGVHRNTIITSYEELEAQGWLVATPGRGSFVNQSLPVAMPQPLGATDKARAPRQVAGFALASDAKYQADAGLLRTRPYELHFDDGCPDVRIAPIDLLARHYRSVLNSRSKHQFDYSWDLLGTPALRKQLVNYLAETRGINVTVDNILVTRGSLMGFYLLFKNLLSPGDTVVVGETNYQPVNEIIQSFGGVLQPVAVDEQGIDTAALEACCQRKKIRAVYVVPHHHHPTTVSLSCDRRMKLLMLSRQYGFAIIEDDYDFDFHYKSSPILPLMSSDEDGMVVYTGSFSKSIAPALRLGYVVAPQNVIQRLAYSRRYIDRQGDTLMERALALMMEEGEVKRHLRKALITYRERRDHFCSLLQHVLSDKVRFNVPEGGLTTWVTFDASIDLRRTVRLAQEKGLFMVDPVIYHPSATTPHATRMGFASMNKSEITRSVEILSEVIG